jgi:hypothetical protein
MKEEYKQNLELHGSGTNSFYTNPNFWECDCPFLPQYIHSKAEKSCTICGAVKEEGFPDAMQRFLDFLTDEEVEEIIQKGTPNVENKSAEEFEREVLDEKERWE